MDATRHQPTVPPFAPYLPERLPTSGSNTPTTSALTPTTFLLHCPTLNPELSAADSICGARRGDIKGVQAVGSKSISSKRTVPADQVRSARKRQKTQPNLEPDQDIKGHQEQDHIKNLRQDQVFRFLELPGELRNRIYTYAAETAHRCFPPIYSKDKPKPRRGRSAGPAPSPSSPTKAASPLPYMGLTQVCSQLRSEFRPAWLSTHKIPLSVLDNYLRTFFPHSDPGASPEAQRRMETQYSPSGSLRIWIRTGELYDVDVLKLLKHAARFPDFTFTVEALPDVTPRMLASILALVSNKTARWVSGVQNNKISQVRLQLQGFIGRPSIRVVVKERSCMPWMKMWSGYHHRRMISTYVEGLGLGDVENAWDFNFGVDYS